MTFLDLQLAAQAKAEGEFDRALALGYGEDQSALIARMEQRRFMTGWLWERLAALDASSSAAEVAAAVAFYPHIMATATGSDRDGCERALVEAMARVQGQEPDYGEWEVGHD